MYDALIIDWAGTITVPMHEMLLAAAGQLEMSETDIATAFGELAQYFVSEDSPVHQAERGELDDDDLAAFIDAQVPGASRLLLDPTGPSFLNGADRPAMIELLEDFREADVNVVLATNNFRVAQDLLARRYLDGGLVSAIVNSALIGTRKPETAFYEIALEAAGVAAEDAVFVDDQEANLVPARDMGMATVLVGADAGAAISILRSQLLR
jgi:FMN phosphatase YigB (HAD superfamily)